MSQQYVEVLIIMKDCFKEVTSVRKNLNLLALATNHTLNLLLSANPTIYSVNSVPTREYNTNYTSVTSGKYNMNNSSSPSWEYNMNYMAPSRDYTAGSMLCCELPHWNLTFMFELIILNGWTQLFLRVSY